MTRRKTGIGRRNPSEFGTVEQRPNGRFRAYFRAEGVVHRAPSTFATRAEARAWLAKSEAALRGGTFIAPTAGAGTLAEFARAWLASRTDIAPKTRENYSRVLSRWILPTLGHLRLDQITPARVGAWRADALFELRFGSTAAYDKILSQYSDMQKGAKDAADGVQELRDQIAQAEADLRATSAGRTGLEYSLSIASQYGDTIRTAQITGEIAKLSAQEQADKTKLASLNSDLAAQQEALNNSLLGNSDAAIKNRSEVLALVSAYQAYIVELANSGAPQEVLNAAIRQATTDFAAQLEAMGYNSDEINDTYIPAISGMADTIRDVPPEIDVDIADLSPEEAAFYEFMERLRANSSVDVAISVDERAVEGEASKIPLAVDRGIQSAREAIAADKKGLSWKAPVSTPYIQTAASGATGNFWDTFWASLVLTSGRGYATGGWTGDGARDDIAGLVHRGEYVFPQEAVRYYGVENLARAHRVAMRGYADGGYTGGPGGGFAGGEDAVGVTELGRSTVWAIADAVAEAISDRPAVLVADGRALARTISAGNAEYARGV